jgi:hypothetical protein
LREGSLRYFAIYFLIAFYDQCLAGKTAIQAAQRRWVLQGGASFYAMTQSKSFIHGLWGKCMPDKEFLAKHLWLKPIADHLLDPQLWRMQHEAVARGVAVGLFWAFATPAAQVLIAAVHCVRWRANLPVAALMTMVTNPLTIGFWLWLAHLLGSLVLNESVQAGMNYSPLPTQWLAEYVWPAVVGMCLFAVGFSVAGYVAVKLIWRLNTKAKRWRRRLGR